MCKISHFLLGSIELFAEWVVGESRSFDRTPVVSIEI